MFIVKTIRYEEDFAYDNLEQVVDAIVDGELVFNDIDVICDDFGRPHSARVVISAYIQDLIENSFSFPFCNTGFTLAFLEIVRLLGTIDTDLPQYDMTYTFVENILKKVAPLTDKSNLAYSRIILLLPHLK
jgi:hypothetical protein